MRRQDADGIGRHLLRGVTLVRDLALTAIVLPALWPVWLFPWPAARGLARLYGFGAFCFWGTARRAGLVNYRRSLGPSVTAADARRATLRSFLGMATGIADGIQFSRRYRRGRDGWDRLIDVEDTETEARVLADPRPKVFVTAHLGSWEVAAAIAGRRQPGAIIGRRVDNPFLDRVVRWIRFQNPGEWIEKKGASGSALAYLRQGRSVAVLADEDAGRDGVFVEFFGRPASTTRMPALLALLADTPVVVAAALRRGPGTRFLYRLAMFEPPQSVDPDANVRELTQQIATTFERWIRDDPDQWRWLHWRWRTRPDGAEETYTRRDVTGCFLTGGSAAGRTNHE